jgi:hypothetical protein
MQELIQALKERLNKLSNELAPAKVLIVEGKSYIELEPLTWNTDQKQSIENRCQVVYHECDVRLSAEEKTLLRNAVFYQMNVAKAESEPDSKGVFGIPRSAEHRTKANNLAVDLELLYNKI